MYEGDMRTWREGRSSQRIPIRVWRGDVEILSWTQEGSEREGMNVDRFIKSFFFEDMNPMQSKDLDWERNNVIFICFLFFIKSLIKSFDYSYKS